MRKAHTWPPPARSPAGVRLRAAGWPGGAPAWKVRAGLGPGVGDVECRYCAIWGRGASATLFVLSFPL